MLGFKRVNSSGTPAIPRRVASAMKRSSPCLCNARALSSQTERLGVATTNERSGALKDRLIQLDMIADHLLFRHPFLDNRSSGLAAIAFPQFRAGHQGFKGLRHFTRVARLNQQPGLLMLDQLRDA